MDHPVPIVGSELVRPWRRATLVATGIAGLELVLLVVAGMVLLGRSVAPQVHAAAAHTAAAPKAATQTQAQAPTPVKRHARPPAAAMLPRAKTSVLVLNGNGISGAAAQTSALVKARGYVVKEVGNAPHTGYPATSVQYPPGLEREARRFARDMNLTRVGPLDGITSAQLHGAKLLLLLGTAR